MTDLQARLCDWHRERFPDADPFHIFAKLAEETGEVGKAMNGLLGETSATGGGDVLEEAADVVISVMVLVGRCYGGDVLEAVERKLAVLNDPNSGHRAALR